MLPADDGRRGGVGGPDRQGSQVRGGLQSEPDGIGGPRQNDIRPVRNQGQEGREGERIGGIVLLGRFKDARDIAHARQSSAGSTGDNLKREGHYDGGDAGNVSGGD